MLYNIIYHSPLGGIKITSTDSELKSLCFSAEPVDVNGYVPPIVQEAMSWLDSFFNGKEPPTRPAMSPEGTEFQLRVWNELLKLKWNERITYGELARRVGSHPRAVGQAVGCNPLPLFIPCHRIVSANGIGGYTPGIELKMRLLDLESSGDNAGNYVSAPAHQPRLPL
ncbi:MAG: methylated-DNA--[protein]-cysteine S-methyltransferase [Muribaculaceae bacterium]|nr:methylated-DNA--[protein]-cysteine S-methyltransferase [Muribaculaceae bacterium]